MSFKVYDCRKDIRNVLVTPQIRARLCRMEPGSGSHHSPHTHDLGHEIFLILSGRVEFKIDGQTNELGPGQMCVALADQPHSVRVLGDEPVHMYLSVTPHIQPTHTHYSDDGERLPPRFRPSSDYDTETDTTTSVDDLIDRHIDTARALAQAAQDSVQVQQNMADRLKQALASGDEQSAGEIRNTMWEAHLATFKKVNELAGEWNALVPRAGGVKTVR